MTLTVISHFYNEEYLLPWWLSHHREIFDHGIMIDYHSTDSSVELIKSLCPTWEIVTSRNVNFSAHDIDAEVMDIESQIQGWRMCLNTTEFLTGDPSILQGLEPAQIVMPACPLIATDVGEEPDPHQPLLDQARTGANFSTNFLLRRARSAHNYAEKYPGGRHYDWYNTDRLIVAWAGFWPLNQSMLDRKIQIGSRLAEIDRQMGWGSHHLLDQQGQLSWWREHWLPKAESIEDLVGHYQQLLRDWKLAKK